MRGFSNEFTNSSIEYGYSVSVFNRSSEKTDEMVKESEGKNIHPTYSIEEFVNSLEKPRKILLMVKAGMVISYQL